MPVIPPLQGFIDVGSGAQGGALGYHIAAFQAYFVTPSTNTLSLALGERARVRAVSP